MNKNNTIIPAENTEQNAEQICEVISQQTKQQCEEIITRAQSQAEDIAKNAQTQAEEIKQQLLNIHKKELEKTKEKIFSTLNLEKRKVTLTQKSLFVESVFTEVKALAQKFRKQPEYQTYLIKSVCISLKILDIPTVNVLHSNQDAALIQSQDFQQKLTTQCRQQSGQDVQFSFTPLEFSDIGVIVQSEDKHQLVDNRFLTLLHQNKDTLWRQLLQEEW